MQKTIQTLSHFLIFFAFFCGSHGKANFLPKNQLHLEDQMSRLGGISEEQFHAIANRIYAYYEPIVYQLGGDLQIRRYWSSSVVNASAQQRGDDWIVNLYGGLARRPEIDVDGFTLVVCHEIGHHLAGFPQVSSWAANEGNSDYFATQSCAKSMWQKEVERNRLAANKVNPIAKSLCETVHNSDDDKALCFRLMNASFSAGRLLALLGGDQEVISWETPDLSEVEQTDFGYPNGQCRFDTLISGSLCELRYNHKQIPWNESELMEQSCHQVNTLEVTKLRPRCWFHPRLSAAN